LNGYYPTESEVVAIIRRLDIDADSKISYDEFIEAMKP
jgi:Ca2+-binding EF-hand superfamily protein